MQRIKSFDLARGFTVLMIAPIHTVLVYSAPEVRDTLMGKLMAFIAEGPGAQLFMLLMGCYFGMSQKNAFLKTGKKAAYLFMAALGLNVFKFVIPYFFGWLPEELLADLHATGWISLLRIGDILHFAALAVIILFLLSRLPGAPYIAVALAFLIAIFAPRCWDKNSIVPVADYLLKLLGGGPPQVFFPLLPWLVYPLVGYWMGAFLKNKNQQEQLFWLCRDFGWLFILLGILYHSVFPNRPVTSFYRTRFADTAIHLGIVLVTLSVWQWIVENVKTNRFFDLLSYLSGNITTIYLAEWVIICWLLPFFGYHALDFNRSLFAIIITGGLTMLITYLINAKSNRQPLTPDPRDKANSNH